MFNITDNVEVIESFAFSNSAIENLTLYNKKAGSIKEYAFSNCTYLTNIVYCGLTDVSLSVFNNVTNVKNIYVQSKYKDSLFAGFTITAKNAKCYDSAKTKTNPVFLIIFGVLIVSYSSALIVFILLAVHSYRKYKEFQGREELHPMVVNQNEEPLPLPVGYIPPLTQFPQPPKEYQTNQSEEAKIIIDVPDSD